MHKIKETARLQLMEFESQDADLLHLLTADEEVMRFFPKPLTFAETEDMLRKILDHYERYGHCFWKILLKPKGEFVGIAGLLHQEIEGNVETEIAYRVLPKHQNQGYATEAALACKEYAERVLGRDRLISLIHPQNCASERVAEKLGARRTRLVEFLGEPHDLFIH